MSCYIVFGLIPVQKCNLKNARFVRGENCNKVMFFFINIKIWTNNQNNMNKEKSRRRKTVVFYDFNQVSFLKYLLPVI